MHKNDTSIWGVFRQQSIFLGGETILFSAESIESAHLARSSVAQDGFYNLKFVPQHFSPTDSLTQKQDFYLQSTEVCRYPKDYEYLHLVQWVHSGPHC